MYKVKAAVLAATEQRNVLHDVECDGPGPDYFRSQSKFLFPNLTIDVPRCRQSLSTRPIFGNGWGENTVNISSSLKLFGYGFPLLATQEFDQHCFDYGLELDEDVRSQIIKRGFSAIKRYRRRRRFKKP